ncbi:MAG: tetratricopeptide repeat protein [Gammaproteobacteria bacterium]
MKLCLLFQRPLILWSFGCVLLLSAYWPGLAGPLVFDDQLNIAENPAVAIHDLSFHSLKRAALSNESGRLKRILPALSFGINHYLAGGFSHTFAFKITNLCIHLINSALVFGLCLLLWPRCKTVLYRGDDAGTAGDAASPLPAACAALLWALHPLQTTAVVYVVQRMTSMSATFVLLGLTFFLLGRERLAERRAHSVPLMAGGLIGGTALGLLCKENAALLGLYAGVIEFTLFSRDTLAPPQKRQLIRFYTLLLAVPLFAGFIYMFIYPGDILNGYAGRPFTLAERLLTQARVLWFYLYLLCVPDVIAMGLFHDDVTISSGWLSPATTLPSVSAWGLVILLAVLLRKQSPVIAFAILWYLAGHSMESSFIPLEMVFEHRNYLPILGPVIMLCALANGLIDAIVRNRAVLQRHARQAVWLKTLLAFGVIAALYQATAERAAYWRSEDGFITSQAINHPLSASTQYLYGEVLYKKQHNPPAAYPFYFRAAQLKPQEAGFLISLHMVTPVAAQRNLQARQLPELLDPRYIERLLREQPVSAWSMRALDVAGRCVIAKYVPCREHLDDMRSWLHAFADNPRTGGNFQRHFTNVLFDIEMAYARYDQALLTIEKAQTDDPGFMRYALMHADVLAAKKRYREALHVLAEAQQKWRQDKAAVNNIVNLRKAITLLAKAEKR